MIKRRVFWTSAGKYIKNFYNAMKIDIRIIDELIISASLEVKSSNNALLLIGIVKNYRCVVFILVSSVDNLAALSKRFYSYRKMKDLKSNNH
jgi:predicted secreted protein